MKITIYELLGLIKDGKAPLRIKYDDLIWILREQFNDYFDEEDYLFFKGFDEHENAKDFLLEQVEILDEEDEFIDIDSYIGNVGKVDESNIEEYIHILFNQQSTLIQNQKKIITALKENK